MENYQNFQNECIFDSTRTNHATQHSLSTNKEGNIVKLKDNLIYVILTFL